MVLHLGLDLEPETLVKGERAGIDRRRNAVHGGPAVVARSGEEPVVQLAGKPCPAVVRRDPDEVDVCLLGVGLREEPAEEAGEPARVVLGHERRVPEVREEEPREHLPHPAPAPPLVDHLGDTRVIGRLGMPDPHRPYVPASSAVSSTWPSRAASKLSRRSADPSTGSTSSA